MNGLILAAGKNRPGENDSTGAFQLAANQFRAINSVSSAPVFFDNSGEEVGSYAAVRARVLKAVKEGGSSGLWDTVAIFCHGGTNALWSAGLIGASGAKDLADAIRPRASANVIVVLYACNAGNAGGFASLLATDLADKHARVYGHTSARHTYANPDTTVYPDATWVIPTSSPLWKNWNDDIIDQSNDLWARFPFMSPDELAAELGAPEYLLGRWKVGKKPDFSDNVFFADATVVQTGDDPDLRYAIFDEGKWSADAHKVTVTWDSGITDEWPLHLSLHGQHVRRKGDGEGTKQLTATRIEAPNVNYRDLFQRSGGGNTSEVGYA
jgi:hypothetical protein